MRKEGLFILLRPRKGDEEKMWTEKWENNGDRPHFVPVRKGDEEKMGPVPIFTHFCLCFYFFLLK